MKRYNRKQFKTRYSELVQPLLTSLADNPEEMAEVHAALFPASHLAKVTTGKILVHAVYGFAIVGGYYLHYEIEYVVTSEDLHTVGSTLRNVIVYDNEAEYESAREYRLAKN